MRPAGIRVDGFHGYASMNAHPLPLQHQPKPIDCRATVGSARQKNDPEQPGPACVTPGYAWPPPNLAFCSLHHKAFDLAVFTIQPDRVLLVSERAHGRLAELKEDSSLVNWFLVESQWLE